MTDDPPIQFCLKWGTPVTPTFTPICMLPKGHEGECNWEERVELRNKLIEEARKGHADES